MYIYIFFDYDYFLATAIQTLSCTDGGGSIGAYALTSKAFILFFSF